MMSNTPVKGRFRQKFSPWNKPDVTMEYTSSQLCVDFGLYLVKCRWNNFVSFLQSEIGARSRYISTSDHYLLASKAILAWQVRLNALHSNSVWA